MTYKETYSRVGFNTPPRPHADDFRKTSTMMDDMLFKVVYQHFDEGLFGKTLNMYQATQLALLIMSHVPKQLQKPVTLNDVQKALPEPSQVVEGEYCD
jgi:transposase